MKQIMTSITLLDKCLFVETQNMHVPLKGLRNKKYKGTKFVSILQYRWNKFSKHIINHKQNFKKISEPKDSIQYTVQKQITSND